MSTFLSIILKISIKYTKRSMKYHAIIDYFINMDMKDIPIN